MSARRKRLTDVENSPAAGNTPKRRRPNKDDKLQEQIAICQEIYDSLKNQKIDGKTFTEWFQRAPSRRSDPKYYDVVKTPIDFARIQQKLKMDEYRNLEEFGMDIELLIGNTKSYYKESDDEFKVIQALEEAFIEKKERQSNGTENKPVAPSPAPSSRMSMRSSTPCDSASRASASREALDQNVLEDILASLLDLTDDHGRLLSPPFRVLQSAEEFPTYYEKIKEPIDFKTIAEKARAGAYSSYNQLDADIRLLCKNAKVFNEPGSIINKDSTSILRFFTKKVKEVHCGAMKPLDDKRIEYNKDIIDSLIAQSSSSDSLGELSEDSEEDEDTEKAIDHRWKLYWIVRNEPDEADKDLNLSEPFLELPDKRYYPDYYDEISTPVSLFMINKKLKRGDYSNLISLVDDLMQMYSNACSYNLEDSEIYKAAKHLEQLTLATARGLQKDIDLKKYMKTELVETVTPKRSYKPRKETKEKEKDSDEDSEKVEKPKKRRKTPSIISTGLTPSSAAIPGKPGRKSLDELQLRYRLQLMTFWKHVHDFKEGDYWPALAFMAIPSKTEYPDYYKVIKRPIDMTMIKQKIEMNGYNSSLDLLTDFSIMFNNCRKFNEPDSLLHNDATRLESMVRMLHDRTPHVPLQSPLCLKEQFGSPVTSKPIARAPASAKNESRLNTNISKLPEEQQRMWALFNDVKDYQDESGRKIANDFLKLPSKQEYPDYYEVIKKPVDFARIQQRLNGQGYPSWSELVADMALMFDNACKYNEPDSQIYKDAVTLASVLMQKKRELGNDSEHIPRVQVEIRTIFTNIFVAVFNKKDSENRCLSDSLIELPDLLKARGIPQEEWPFSFEQIKKNIDKCRYRRLDRFQRDFFALFEIAREITRSDSQMFDDACELQRAFIRERDARCKNVVTSGALLVLENAINENILQQRTRKARSEADEERKADQEANEEGQSGQEGEIDEDLVSVKDVQYRVGNYAYVSPTSEHAKSPNHIMRISRIYKNADNVCMITGIWLFRPHETFHRASRKFIENEVFLTNNADTVTSDRLCGKCVVLFLPSYIKQVVKEFQPSDTYVCESKYMGRQLHFRKLKNWPHEEEDEKLFNLEDRTEELELKIIPSAFVKTVEGEKEDEDDNSLSSSSSSSSSTIDVCKNGPLILDIPRLEVVARGTEKDADGRMYLQQMVSKSGKAFAQGDFVLVFNPQRAICDVMRIDKLWREADGSEYFSGGWFARPIDVQHDPGRMFYLREVFAVSQPDQTRSAADIQTKCAVMNIKDAVKERPTEIPECDVFVCESRVDGSGGSGDSSLFVPLHSATEDTAENVPLHLDFAKRVRSFKTYSLSTDIAEEERYKFKTPIVMEKEMSPLVAKNEVPPIEFDVDLDDNDTDGNESVHGDKSGEMKQWLSHQPKLNAKSKSGYILFSAEVRKRIMSENPDAGFGEVSKIVGIEWKKISDEQKKQYEVRAEYIATERAKQEQANMSVQQLQPGQCRVWMCKWISCEFMCDHGDGLYDHLVHHHTSQIIPDSEQQFVCMWGQCVRNRKDGKPFPSLPRLHRHLKEKHLASASKVIYQNQRGRQFFRYTPPQGENAAGQLLHFPYGMHPSQVQHAQSQGSVHLPPQLPPHMQNGHSEHTPTRQRAMNGHDQHHPQLQSGSSHTPHPQHSGPPTAGPASFGTPGPSYVVQQQQQQPQQHQQQQVPSGTQPHPAQITDPARTVVSLGRDVEPVFVPAPNSVQVKRVLHTETYIRYIESLTSRQRTVSKFDRSLTANSRNTQSNSQRSAPYHWVKSAKSGPAREDEVVSALWKLRDQLLESTVNVSREYTGVL